MQLLTTTAAACIMHACVVEHASTEALHTDHLFEVTVRDTHSTHDDMEWKSVARSIDLCSQYRTLPSIGCVLARPSMHASGAVNYSAQQSNMLIWNGRIALASPNRPFMTTPRWIDDHRCIACGCSYFCCFVPPTSSGRCYTSHLIMGAH
jgi:hypothetical protein